LLNKKKTFPIRCVVEMQHPAYSEKKEYAPARMIVAVVIVQNHESESVWEIIFNQNQMLCYYKQW
jgi:hypothetical protein